MAMTEGRFPIYDTFEEYNLKDLKPALKRAYQANPEKGSYFHVVHSYRRGDPTLDQTCVERVTGPMVSWWKVRLSQQGGDLIYACAPDANKPLVWTLYFYEQEAWRWNPAHEAIVAQVDEQMVAEIKQWVQQSACALYHEQENDLGEFQRGILFTW